MVRAGLSRGDDRDRVPGSGGRLRDRARRWRRRRGADEAGTRVEVVGGSPGPLRDALAAGGLHARAVPPGQVDPDTDVVVVADGDLSPSELPRRAVRVGWVAAGEAGAFGPDLLEDLDEVLVADAAAAGLLGPRAVAVPRVRSSTDAADELTAVLAEHRRRPSLAVVTGVSNLRMRQRWGDHHFAVAAAKALRRAGWSARVLCQAELAEHDLGAHDAVLLLAGKVDLAPVPATPTLVWVISHPERVDAGALADVDRAFVASERFAAALAGQGAPVEVLHQCTDPDRFRPTPGGPVHELLFVGNSRGTRRRIIDDLPAGRELAVYGYGWDEALLDPAHLHGDHVPNDELAAYYTAATLVLNDHWDAMRERAFPSNRLYDAAACGAAVLSDHVDGLDALFDGAITTYRDRSELARRLDELLADAGLRRELGERGRAAVLDRHTFDHRVGSLLSGVRSR